MVTETYEKEIECPNCGIKKTFNIEKGKTLLEFEKETLCENCKCSLNWFESIGACFNT